MFWGFFSLLTTQAGSQKRPKPHLAGGSSLKHRWEQQLGRHMARSPHTVKLTLYNTPPEQSFWSVCSCVSNSLTAVTESGYGGKRRNCSDRLLKIIYMQYCSLNLFNGLWFVLVKSNKLACIYKLPILQGPLVFKKKNRDFF